ncbi:hypothetical protein AVEN_258368-1 [Araneus ventricosus]|uniref:Uncharacterized protein n=1 Tax=Araneus ventricosus TaxID=182803 RepID=A0A4Y2NHE5_ARAVE|nr:hypothetical protein AVEN_258368-1 [Araneus ventricosus]
MHLNVFMKDITAFFFSSNDADFQSPPLFSESTTDMSVVFAPLPYYSRLPNPLLCIESTVAALPPLASTQVPDSKESLSKQFWKPYLRQG